jgi:hypothetical protein
MDRERSLAVAFRSGVVFACFSMVELGSSGGGDEFATTDKATLFLVVSPPEAEFWRRKDTSVDRQRWKILLGSPIDSPVWADGSSSPDSVRPSRSTNNVNSVSHETNLMTRLSLLSRHHPQSRATIPGSILSFCSPLGEKVVSWGARDEVFAGLGRVPEAEMDAQLLFRNSAQLSQLEQ